MTSKSDGEIIAALGQVALLAHVIEDLLKLHVFEAGRYGVAGANERTVEQIKGLSLKSVISQFKKMYPARGAQADALDLLREIRNEVFHAFCPDVGKDLLTFEGRDQIHALLLRIIDLQTRHLESLKKLHEELLRTIVSQGYFLQSISRVARTSDWNVTSVAKSQLLQHVEELKSITQRK